MPVLENASGTATEVDNSMKAARVSMRPPESLSWNSIAAKSGLITGIAAASPLFSFRNSSANPIILRRLGVGFMTTTAFTTAQMIDFEALIARAFSASDAGGTAIAMTGNNAKHRTSLGTLSSIDCRIATTGALTAGARTLDANAFGMAMAWSGAQGAALPLAQNNLLGHDAEDYPIVLAQNEGFIIRAITAFGAGGVGNLFVQAEIAEASSY